MAQLVARLNGIQKARGSNPLTSTTSGQGYFVHRCYCNGLTYEPALPFSQKSFALQNIFGSPNNTWCPRWVFHTPKSTTSGQGYVVRRCKSNGLTYQPAPPFSQKSFAMQNLFRSPDRLCSTKKLQHTKSTRCCVSCAFLLLYLVFFRWTKSLN